MIDSHILVVHNEAMMLSCQVVHVDTTNASKFYICTVGYALHCMHSLCNHTLKLTIGTYTCLSTELSTEESAANHAAMETGTYIKILELKSSCI